MKIVYLYSSLAIMGGVERVLVDKMNYLVSHGYEVYMITADQGQHPIPYKLDERIRFYDLQIRFHSQYQYSGLQRLKEAHRLRRLYFLRLKKKIIEICPDLMVCTTSIDVHRLLRIKGNIPLVVESHNNFSHPDSWWHCLLNRVNNFWIGKADTLVALTHADAINWRRVSRNVHVIPNIVHLNDSGRYSDCTNKRAVFVGRLVEQKGIPDLIKVWRIVNQRHPDWQLDVYGNGQMESIPEIKIIVHPPTQDIMEEYINSSMLLMTSIFEPFGLVLPEAMSCGLPVVAFNCPFGPAEIIVDGKDGYVIRNRDIESFANQVCKLIKNQQLRHQMGMAAVQSVQRYTKEYIMPMWEELFESLIRS
jgi:glycosyltransferase involved in cell wall biosynthesis